MPSHRPLYRIDINKNNPPINTTTGTQNCTSVKTQINNPRSLSIARLSQPQNAARENTTSCETPVHQPKVS
jgi:hypothetical protein